MKTVGIGRGVMALAASLAVGLSFGATNVTVRSGEVLPVGTIGSGPNNWHDGSVITLEAGATLKGTNEPPYGSWTIWPHLYATNGIAYLDGTEMTPLPNISDHAILTDGLVIVGKSSISFSEGNVPGEANWLFRDLAGLSFADGSGSVVLAQQATLISTPTNENVVCGYSKSEGTLAKRVLAIAGPDLRLTMIQNDPADFTGLGKVYLFDDAYIPDGHAVNMGSGTFRIHPAVANRATRKWESVEGSGTVSHAIALDGGTLELYAPSNTSYAFNGKVSGSGTINFRCDLSTSVATCSFAEIDGQFAFRTGTSGRTLAVTVTKLAAGSVLEDGGVVNVTLSPEDAAKVQAFALANGTIRYVMPDAQGCIPATSLPAASRRLSDCVIVKGETEIAGMPAAKISAAAGARVTLTHDGTQALNVVPGTGTVAVATGVPLTLPIMWFDASKSYDRGMHGGPYYAAPASANTQGKDFGNLIMTNDFFYIEKWNDWRGTGTGRLYIDRYYDGNEFIFYAHCYAYLAVGAGPNNLGYVDFGVYNDKGGGTSQPVTQVDHTDAILKATGYNSKRRLYLSSTVKPKAVIMVFGSQKGGGDALLGTGSNHFFLRGRTLADPIVTTAPANTTFWLDGTQVADPTAQTFNGGWQIVSISGAAVEKTDGIGYDANYQDAGGQNYAEIIFFQDELTDAVRTRYEQYLAKKWGLSYPEQQPDVVIAEGRGGTLELTSATGMELKGTFAGTVSLNGGKVTIADPLPPTAEDLPSEGRLRWFDADAPGAIVSDTVTSGDKDFPNVMRGLLERGKSYSEVQEGDTYLYGQGDRAPFFRREARGLAAARTWIDFNHPVDFRPKGDDGNTLRTATFGASCEVASPAKTGVLQTFRTAFMAMDSSMGGGSPLLSAVMGTSGDFRARQTMYYTTALWPPACADNVKNGATHINGVVVNGTQANTLTGGAETMTLVAAGDVSAAFLDYLSNSQSSGTPLVPKYNGIIFGELLLYTTELSASDIAKVEAYLQGKWTGTLPSGYSDLREATVDGSGELSVPDVARLPKIAPTFAGSVAVGGSTATLAFEISDAGVLTGAINAPEATFDLPPAVTLSVTSGLLPRGRYPLLVCKGLANPVEWTLDVQSTRTREYALLTETKDGVTRVVLEVKAPGLLLLLN